MSNENKKPIRKHQIGTVQVAVWKNEVKTKTGDSIELESYTLQYAYKKGEKDGKPEFENQTINFGSNKIACLTASYLLEKAMMEKGEDQ